jgi:Protein of unknown function (DUF2934)
MEISRTNSEKKRSFKRASQARTMSDEERRGLIAEAAYLRALERGFEGGDPVSDWLAAESEINERLAKSD